MGFQADPGGPLYCEACRVEYRLAGVVDLTLDSQLMAAVAYGSVDTDPPRVKRAAGWFEWDGDRLWTTTGDRRLVPAIKQR